ncbi:hypothetical protein C8R46DRAFT_1056584 [Mycena filopes]|nr:hypothetical protein C8R46DRAFT_1056584 [Mycena filopes]
MICGTICGTGMGRMGRRKRRLRRRGLGRLRLCLGSVCTRTRKRKRAGVRRSRGRVRTSRLGGSGSGRGGFQRLRAPTRTHPIHPPTHPHHPDPPHTHAHAHAHAFNDTPSRPRRPVCFPFHFIPRHLNQSIAVLHSFITRNKYPCFSTTSLLACLFLLLQYIHTYLLYIPT